MQNWYKQSSDYVFFSSPCVACKELIPQNVNVLEKLDGTWEFNIPV